MPELVCLGSPSPLPATLTYTEHSVQPCTPCSGLFELGARCTRPQCAAVLDIYGDHLLYCERGFHRIRRHDAKVQLLPEDLANAARHTIAEERPLGWQR